MRYIDLIHAIKQAPNGFYFGNLSGETHSKIARLHKIGCINLDVEHRAMAQHRLIATVAPKAPQNATPDTVQVSYWRDGSRNGLFSQQAYDVIERTGEWVSYRDALGRKHTVKAEHTRAAA